MSKAGKRYKDGLYGELGSSYYKKILKRNYNIMIPLFLFNFRKIPYYKRRYIHGNNSIDLT